MLFPIFVAAWETDATARAALQESVASSLSDFGGVGALSGGDLTLEGKAVAAQAAYLGSAHGYYARFFDLTTAEGLGLPADNVSADASLTGSWQVGPASRLGVDTRGYLATALGVRAFDQLAVRDPFLQNRAQYTLSDAITYTTVVSKRTSITMTGGYVQMGAVAAEDEAAVGVDMHQGVADVMYNIEISPIDVLSPELRYTGAHYYNAILDLQLTRGPIDVHTGSALVGLTHPFGKRLSVTLTGGATVATPPPILDQAEPVVSPEVRVTGTYFDRRWRASLAYAYTYASLGPGIGYGKQHIASLEVALRPAAGGRYRDLLFRGIFSASAGSAPISADPVAASQVEANGREAILYSQSLASGAQLEYPLRRGIAMVTGVDVQLSRTSFDPQPPGVAQGLALNAILTVGIAGTIWTDPARTVGRDPEDQADDARAAAEAERRPLVEPPPEPKNYASESGVREPAKEH